MRDVKASHFLRDYARQSISLGSVVTYCPVSIYCIPTETYPPGLCCVVSQASLLADFLLGVADQAMP
jgi:hypothetical protein